MPTQPSNSEAQPSLKNKIWHTTFGSTSKPALLLLHGIFNSHLEFLYVVPYLKKDFYVILVDLPGHSRSSSPTLNTYRLPQIADALADLITDISPTHRAHVVGVSYGGYCGLELARLHPDVVESLFASGAPPYNWLQKFLAKRPWLNTLVQASIMYLPDQLYWMIYGKAGVLKDSDLRKENKANFSKTLVANGFGGALAVTVETIGQIKGTRVLAVAGGQQDDIDMSKKMGHALTTAGGAHSSECKAVVVRKAIHAWDVEYPKLFVEGVKAWVEERDLPEEFEELMLCEHLS
jgi:pimeloyl-ACP methyl ester carboxylesterase